MAQRKPTPKPTPPYSMAVVLAVNCKADREAHGWTQEELGVYAGLTRATVGVIEKARENGRDNSSTQRTIEAIARVLQEGDWLALITPRAALQARYDQVATRVYLNGQPQASGLRSVPTSPNRPGQPAPLQTVLVTVVR